MACGSCGGARARTVTGLSGQQRLADPKKTVYKWHWIPSSGGKGLQFDTKADAKAHLADNPGSLALLPVT